MKTTAKPLIIGVALTLLALGCYTTPTHAQSAADWDKDIPQVTAPPESFFAKIPERDRAVVRVVMQGISHGH